MRPVTLVLATSPQPLPVGSTFANGQYRFSIGAGIPDQVVAGTQATFADVPAGSYTATVQGLDDTGAELGAPVTADFDVTDEAATWMAPLSVSVNVG